jgi:hypothetical protein
VFRAARLKLTGMYAISFFLILLLFAIVRFVMFTHYVDAQVDAGISALVSDVVHTPGVGSSTATATASATETPFDPVPAELFYFVLDGETGTPVVNHRNLDPTSFLGLQVTQRAAQGQANWDTLSIDGARYRVLAAPVYTGADIGETVLAV